MELLPSHLRTVRRSTTCAATPTRTTMIVMKPKKSINLSPSSQRPLKWRNLYTSSFFHLFLADKEEIDRRSYGIFGKEGAFHRDVGARIPPG